ncbi:MAG TPA: lysoplasmalogenase [Propionibacteriaceae bacterium]
MTLSAWSKRWLGLYGAVAVVALLAELTGARTLFAGALVALMPLLAAFTVSVRRRLDPQHRSRLLRLTLAALFFSWLGDLAGYSLLPKVGCFLLAQLCYVAAFWPRRARSVWRRPAVAASYAAVVAVLIVVVARDAGPLAVAVMAYGASLGLMATLATGVNRVAALGGALFVVSDTILALDVFVRGFALPHAPFWNILTYVVAQLLLVWGALRLARSEGTSQGER